MEILSIFNHALMISFFVFVMMLLVDFVDVATQKRVSNMMQGGMWRQYMLASLLGSTPGCLGAFMNVSLYVHGMISFGAIVGGMIATSGDEAFVMLVQFPGAAMMLFGMLFGCGILFAWISDKIIGIFGFVPCESCRDSECEVCLACVENEDELGEILYARNLRKNIQSLSFTRFLLLLLIGSFLVLVLTGIIGGAHWTWKRTTFCCLSLCSLYISVVVSEHYLHAHIWDHLIKRHILKVFLWTFGALCFVHWGLSFWDLNAFIREHMMWVFLVGTLMGLVPESDHTRYL